MPFPETDLVLQDLLPLDGLQNSVTAITAALKLRARSSAGIASVSLAGLSGNVTLTADQARTREVVLSGAPSGAVTLKIDNSLGANSELTIINGCTGANSTVTVKSAGANSGNSSGVTLVSGETRTVRQDGDSVYGLVGVPTPWTAPTLLNSWVNYGSGFQNAAYRKVGDRVEVRGLIKSGTIGSAAFQLPAGFRPQATVLGVAISNSTIGRVDVDTSGNVIPGGGGGTGSNTWFALDCLWFSVL